MKSETEIRSVYTKFSEIVEAARRRDVRAWPPPEFFVVHNALKWIVDPWKGEQAARDRKTELLLTTDCSEQERAGHVLAADVLAWALDETEWPNFQLACDVIKKLTQSHARMTARIKARRN